MTGIPEAIEFKSFIPGLDDHYFTILLMMLLDYVIIFIIFALGSINPTMKPKKAQNLVEWTVKYITDTADSIIGEQAPKYYGLIVMLFFYILIGNFIGLVPGLTSPTSSLTVTAALAILVFFWYWIAGLIEVGPLKFFAHFTGGPGIPGPLKPFMFFVEMLSDISRPLSLSFRLFGNLIAKEILLGVLVFLVIMFWPDLSSHEMLKKIIAGGIGGFAFLLRPLIIVLGTLVSIIQAGVFALLTSIYLAGAVAAHHGDEHGEEHAH